MPLKNQVSTKSWRKDLENEDKDDILKFKRKAKRLSRRKYKLLGINDEILLNRLVDFDSMYSTYMYLYRKDFDENLQKLLDELPDDF